MLWNVFQDYLTKTPEANQKYRDFCSRYDIETDLEDNLILQHLEQIFRLIDSPQQAMQKITSLDECLKLAMETDKVDNKQTLILLNNTELKSYEAFIGVFPSKSNEDPIVAYSKNELTWEDFKNKGLFFPLAANDSATRQSNVPLQILTLNDNDKEDDTQIYSYTFGAITQYLQPLTKNDINFTFLNTYLDTIRLLHKNALLAYLAAHKEIWYIKHSANPESVEKLDTIKQLILNYANQNLTKQNETFTNQNTGTHPHRAIAVNLLLKIISQNDISPNKKLELLKNKIDLPKFASFIGREDSHFIENLTSGRKLGLATTIGLIDRELNNSTITTDNFNLALASPDYFISFILDENAYKALSTKELERLYLAFPKLFAIIVMNFYSTEKFIPFTVNSQEITTEILHKICFIPNSKEERQIKNKFLTSIGLEQELALDRIYPGIHPEDIHLAQEKPYEAYQLTEQDIQLGIHSIITEFPDKFYNQFIDENKSTEQASFYLLPTAWYNTLSAKADKSLFRKDVFNLIYNQSNKSIIVCGILSVGKNHFVPYFIARNTTNNILCIRTVNPSATSKPNDAADPKVKECLAIKNLFKLLFGEFCDYQDAFVTQQLGERHCGDHALQTLHDLISKEGVNISDNGSLTLDISKLSVNGNLSQELDYQLNCYFYSADFNETTLQVRTKWTSKFQAATEVPHYFLSRDKSPITLDSIIEKLPEAYNYDQNVTSQKTTDTTSNTLSEIVSFFVADDNVYNYVKNYYALYFTLPNITETQFYQNSLAKLNARGLDNTLAHKTIEDILYAQFRNDIPALLHKYFIRALSDFLAKSPNINPDIDFVSVFFTQFPNAFKAFKTLDQGQQTTLQQHLVNIVQKDLAAIFFPEFAKMLTQIEGNISHLNDYINKEGDFYAKVRLLQNTFLINQIVDHIVNLFTQHIKNITIGYFFEQLISGKLSLDTDISDAEPHFSAIFQLEIQNSVKAKEIFFANFKTLFTETKKLYLENFIRKDLFQHTSIQDYASSSFSSFLTSLSKKSESSSVYELIVKNGVLTETGKLISANWSEILKNVGYYQHKVAKIQALQTTLSNIVSLVNDDPKVDNIIKLVISTQLNLFIKAMSTKKIDSCPLAKLNEHINSLLNLVIPIIPHLQNLLRDKRWLNPNKTSLLYFILNLCELPNGLCYALTYENYTMASELIIAQLKGIIEKPNLLLNISPKITVDSFPAYSYGMHFSDQDLESIAISCLFKNYKALSKAFLSENRQAFFGKLKVIISHPKSSEEEKSIAWTIVNSASMSFCQSYEMAEKINAISYLKLRDIIPDSLLLSAKRITSRQGVFNLFPSASATSTQSMINLLNEMKTRHDGKSDFFLDYTDLSNLRNFIISKSDNLADSTWREFAEVLATELSKHGDDTLAQYLAPQSSPHLERDDKAGEFMRYRW
jgi:hypothetical protein